MAKIIFSNSGVAVRLQWQKMGNNLIFCWDKPVYQNTKPGLIDRPEVRKLLLFYFYFFLTWSWKIIPYLLFYFFLTWSWKIIPYLLFYFFLTWSWKIIPYVLFYFFSNWSWKIIPYFDDGSNSRSIMRFSLCWPPHEWKPGAPPVSDVSASRRVHVMGQTDNSILNIFLICYIFPSIEIDIRGRL